MEEIASQVYKRSTVTSTESEYPIHQLQENYGVNWIVIDSDIVHDDATNSYFEQIRLPNGDIHLRLVNIFTDNSKNNGGRPQPSQEADDQITGSNHVFYTKSKL